MREITLKASRALLTATFAVLAIVGLTSTAAATPAPAPTAITSVAAQPACGDVSSYQKDKLSALPPEATDTVNLIKKGGPYPYPQDDGIFSNREGVLPSCASDYYREYTVETPGSPDRGARRFVKGDGGEYFYTDDHYSTFSIVDINS
jgi:ribonuclease T1